MAEPYLVTIIRQIAGLEAANTPSLDDTARLTMCRRWLDAHYPDVAAALAREYAAMRSREAACRAGSSTSSPSSSSS